MAWILAEAGLILGAVAVAWEIISGSGLDGRHVTGYVGWMLFAALMTGRTAVRLGEYMAIRERDIRKRNEDAWDVARAAQEAAQARAATTGTWTGDADGMVLTVRMDSAGRLVVQGWLSDHWQQGEERVWSQDPAGLADMVGEMERSGELAPVDDAGTVFIRAMLDLGAWPIPSFDEIERDWSARDGDTQVVPRTA